MSGGIVCQALDEARDNTVAEWRRRNDTDRFYRIEVDNNVQLQKHIKVVTRELATNRQSLAGVEKQCTDITSEV